MRDRCRLPSSETGVGTARWEPGSAAVQTGRPGKLCGAAACLPCSSMPWAHPVQVPGLSPQKGSRDRARGNVSERRADCRLDASLGLIFPEHVPEATETAWCGVRECGFETFLHHFSVA